MIIELNITDAKYKRYQFIINYSINNRMVNNIKLLNYNIKLLQTN